MQLRELARLNGTLREDDNRYGIGLEGHAQRHGEPTEAGGRLATALEVTFSLSTES